jgi:hypothetical protein
MGQVLIISRTMSRALYVSTLGMSGSLQQARPTNTCPHILNEGEKHKGTKQYDSDTSPICPQSERTTYSTYMPLQS